MFKLFLTCRNWLFQEFWSTDMTWTLTMKFRQRIAWLLVMFYLATSFGMLYYTFEINDHYNSLALDHNNAYHNGDKQSLIGSFWHHVTDIPLPVWLVLLIPPYLQMFGLLLAWTRPEPRLSFAYMWPGIVYVRLKRIWKLCQGHTSKPINSAFVQNGHVIIDTWWDGEKVLCI